jgi:hypothetical protein
MTRELADLSTTDNPDIPSEAVGAWPSVDLAQLGLSPLGWLFIAGAALVGAQHLHAILGAPVETVPAAIFSGVAAVAIALLPGALLWRTPAATRTHRLLLAGLAAGAIAGLVRAVIAFWPSGPGGGSWRGTVLDGTWPLLGALGSLLVGLGLRRLRTRRPARLGLLAVIASAYIAVSVVPTWIVVAVDGIGSIDCQGTAGLPPGRTRDLHLRGHVISTPADS